MTIYADSYRSDLADYDYCGNDHLHEDILPAGPAHWIGFIQDEAGQDIQVPWYDAAVLVWGEDEPYLGTNREERTLMPLNVPMA